MRPYRLVLDDAKRNLSKRPGQYHDCTVRAFAIITKTDYDKVYDVLSAAGRKPCQGFDSNGWLKRKRGRAFGGRFRAINHKGLTPATFAARYPKGRYMLETPNHVWVCLNGIHHDLWRVKEQPLSGAWQYIKD